MALYLDLAELAEVFNILSDAIYDREKEIKTLEEHGIEKEYWNYDIESNIDLLKGIVKKVDKENGVQTKLEFEDGD